MPNAGPMVDSLSERRALFCGRWNSSRQGTQTMFGKNPIPDKSLLQSISQRLARTGTGGQSRVTVSVQQGAVTLSGTLTHAIQRDPILKAVRKWRVYAV